MLSIERCRELLPDSAQCTDEQILQIRDALYGIAELALDVYFEGNLKGDLKGSGQKHKER